MRGGPSSRRSGPLAHVRGLSAPGAYGSYGGEHWDEPARADEEDQLKLAGFRVGEDIYGLDIMRIKEVIQAGPYPIRPVPHAPSIVEGVIALRGVVIPVVDLRKRFGTAIAPEQDRLNKLIIVSVRGRIVGLKVDAILGELRVPAAALRPTPSMLRPAGPDSGEFFAGVCRSREQMVFVVNLEALIDPAMGSLAAGRAQVVQGDDNGGR